MKVGDLIYSPRGIRLVLEDYYIASNDVDLPLFRAFKMLETIGRITVCGADQIETYWRVVE